MSNLGDFKYQIRDGKMNWSDQF